MKFNIKNRNGSRKETGQRNLAGSLLFVVILLLLLSSPVLAETTRTLTSDSSTNPNDEGFRLTVCDGPTLPTPQMKQAADSELQAKYHRNYVPCDFNGVMLQVQHLINIAIILGVIMAILGFFYAGYLHITGTQENIKKARSIFPKILGGFILMLSGWFIVYQILSWLTGEGSGLGALLGSS
ncbi:MAG: hypothetical protein V4481_01890 [Patescibacteria group bacterium]